MWKECQGDCLEMIKELSKVQEDQKRRVRNLEETIEDDIQPSLEVLKGSQMPRTKNRKSGTCKAGSQGTSTLPERRSD
jgi:hypothetical protein